MFVNPYVAVTAVGSSGLTYFFEERFEGTGYQNSWTEAGTGTIDEDYTTSPLEGSQGLRIAMTAQTGTTVAVLPSDQDELWAYFKIRVNTALSVNRNIFQLRNSSGTNLGGVLLTTDLGFIAANGTVNTLTTTDKMTLGSDYHVWMHWIKGTGTDGTCTVGFSASGTEATSGNSFRSTTSGVATTDAHDLRVGVQALSTTGEYVIDQILISTTGTIGNSPA